MNIQKIFKIVAFNLILIFILSINNLSQISYATITQTQNKGNINISNIEQGVNIYLYQIATMEYDYISSQPKEGYEWNNSIKLWIEENFADYTQTENFYNNVQSNSEEAKNFYDKLTSAIKENKIELAPYQTQTAEGTSTYPINPENLTGTATFKEVEMGTYLVIIENGYMVYTPSVVNLIPTFNKETNEWILEDKQVIVKATNLSITKTVTDDKTQKDNYSMIDNITYTIKADIPTYLENSLAKKYYISDKLDSSLTINEETLTIWGLKDSNTPESITGYEITFDTTRPETQENVTFLINFDYNTIKDYETIKITYNAKLNSNSVIGIDGNNNYAYLDYSNNPYDKTSIQSQSSEKTTVYTYALEIKSTDKDNSELLLPGSEFSLLDKNGNDMYFIQKEDGKYYLATPEEQGATNTLVVDSEGNLYLYGLDEGTYIVEQTKAPEGYNVSSKTYEVELIDNEPDGELDEDYTLIFPNTKGFILPVTGGKGSIILIGTGTILVCIGLLILIQIFKKKKTLQSKNI